jgi:hypothetical protein
LITFNFVNIAWVFFRSKEWDDALKVLGGMFGFNLGTTTSPNKVVMLFFIVTVFIVITTVVKNSIWWLKNYKKNYAIIFTLLFMTAIIVAFVRIDAPDFLYFNF